MIIPHDTSRKWDTLLADTRERLAAAAKISGGSKIVKADDAVALLEAVIRPFDRVNIEGDNQKQADFLKTLQDSLDHFLAEYNKDKKFDLILNKATVLYSDQKYDITQDVINGLNNRYTK